MGLKYGLGAEGLAFTGLGGILRRALGLGAGGSWEFACFMLRIL